MSLKVIKSSLHLGAFYGDFLSSFNFDAKVNDYEKASNLEEVEEQLKTDTIYIVLKQNRFIGFFVNPINQTNKEISLKIFRNPRACPFSARSLMKAGFLRALGLYVTGSLDIDKIEFVAWHPSLVSVVQAIVVKLSLHQLQPDYFICYHRFDEALSDRYRLVLSKYLGTSEFDPEEFEVVL